MAVKPVTAAGGVVYQQRDNNVPQVVLIFRRDVWDLPKGKIEEGETIKECAVREVAEEIGLANQPKINFVLTDTYHEYEEDGIQFGKTTHWFGMQLESVPENGFNPQLEEDIKKVRWVALPKAKELVGYGNLVEVLNSFESQYSTAD